jgi:hypothetical protein
MARSEESILRRALKRERTEGQQRHADRNEMKRQEQKDVKRKQEQNNKIEDKNKRSRISRVEDTKKREVTLTQAQKEYLSTTKTRPSIGNEERDDKQNSSNNTSSNSKNHDDDSLKEQGAWICTKCQNSNFASRKYCNSKTCDERRPYQIFREQQQQNANDDGSQRRRPNPSSSSRTKSFTNKPRERHDEATSKKLAWSKQADRTTLTKNQELRKLYAESNGTGEGMDPEDFKRAKILIERDQRKQEKIKKKNNQNQALLHEALKGGKKSVVVSTTATTSATTISSGSNEKMEEEKNSNSISNGASTVDDNKNQEEEKKEESKEDNKKSSSSKEEKKKKKKEAQAKRDQNKALRQLYIDTGGKGMKMDQVVRAKLLIARDEKKRNQNEKRAETTKDENK